MRAKLLFLFAALLPAAPAQEKPKGLTVSTWVREDIFAGFLDNDMPRHAAGVKKLETLLSQDHDAADVHAWLGGSELLHAALAHESGDTAGFQSRYASALAHFARAEALAKQFPKYSQAVLAITGGSFTILSDRLPPIPRREGWQRVRTNYTALRAAQDPIWDKLPVHHRGEINAGLAQAAQRLGETDLARKLTAELVAGLPNTPYAVFGKRWLDKPETMAKSKLACATCHDAGRLQAVLNRN